MNKLTPLQALNLLCENICNDEKEMEYKSIIETALKKYEVLQEVHKDFVDKNIKKLKALEIIKNKGISTCSVAINYDDFERYSKSCFRNYNPLTKKEYDLLEEVLKWQKKNTKRTFTKKPKK